MQLKLVHLNDDFLIREQSYLLSEPFLGPNYPQFSWKLFSFFHKGKHHLHYHLSKKKNMLVLLTYRSP